MSELVCICSMQTESWPCKKIFLSSLSQGRHCQQCREKHQEKSETELSLLQERKVFDEKFIRLDTRRLCELTSAADSLDMRPLVDLSSRALARMIEGKSPDEIRETFHLPDDLTEEEKLEPVKNVADDPRIRLLNRLYAKKRKVLIFPNSIEKPPRLPTIIDSTPLPCETIEA